jgi:hypothetical protein
MKCIKLITSFEEFNSEFERCCREYSGLEMYTAWVGNPGNMVPYIYLEQLQSVKIYLGISFNQSSPEGIRRLMDMKYEVKIIDDTNTYHPKLYFFKNETSQALLMGSSNFTYSGFLRNIESNILLEGDEVQNDITNYLIKIRSSIQVLKKYAPNDKWLNEYTKSYNARQDKLKQAKIKEETIREDNEISTISWLGRANWKTYIQEINEGILQHAANFDEPYDLKISMLNEYKEHLPTPWAISIFDTIENRRRILGKRPYGWLGHIGASGRIQQLLVNGSPVEKRAIINSINRISKMEIPINYDSLRRELIQLEQLGPTIKVWGRMLAIIRPDVYCTISSEYVREYLSELLEMPKKYFETSNGYIELLKLIHTSPWFNSKRPVDRMEQDLWDNRVAFLDVVFY